MQHNIDYVPRTLVYQLLSGLGVQTTCISCKSDYDEGWGHCVNSCCCMAFAMPKTGMPGSHALLLTHPFTYHKLRHEEKYFCQCCLLSLVSKASLPCMLCNHILYLINWINKFFQYPIISGTVVVKPLYRCNKHTLVY